MKNENLKKTQRKNKTKQISVFVGVLIKNKKILLTQRFEKECLEAHLKWELPGGKCDFGETPAEAIKREFLEETGVAISIKRFIPFVYTHYWKYKWGIQQTFVFVYECKYIRKVSNASDHHIKDVQWIPLTDIKNYELLGGTEEILKQFKLGV